MKVIYFGPITPKGQASSGGYAAANRKNCDELIELGIDVVEVPKMSNLGLFFQPFKLFRYIGEKNVIVHITPLYKTLLIPAFIGLIVTKLFNIKTVLDLRAGTFMTYYESWGGLWYKKLVKKTLDNADLITVEGSKYIDQIKNIIQTHTPIKYLPNLAVCDNLENIDKPNGGVYNIFYFGRVTRDKGVMEALDATEILGVNYHLYIAGPIAPDMNVDELKKTNTHYLGLLTSNELKEQMKKMHFFIFPTRHKGEGQSNSLIEAMSNGLIPITADQGFCKEVVADCGVVLPVGSKGVAYANAIKQCVEKDMNEQARKCQQHVIEAHNVDTEIKKLVGYYKELLCH